ncbi:MAG TPA: Mov34/MPN/PAD-1 family protein [Cyclobacteriaceae bacterium]|jgi:integrative and conjugative element protein (TIGR02256 family)|nr:Mov34/MPN/PAD-1 family protein [Cyclobacteriaceae bacterium]
MKSFILDTLNIHIDERVLEIIASYKQSKSKQPESGGILLGQVRERNIYVLKASTPTSFDSASRYSFERNKKIAQIIINYEFNNSGRKTIYLGEWHTHPENIPGPSSQDKKMIKDQFTLNELNEPYVLFIIMGLKGFFLGKFDGKNYLGIECRE